LEEDFSLIFDKYPLVDTRKSGIPGVRRLALTFCKLAVESHNEEIGVNFDTNKDTTFWFTLKREGDEIGSWTEEISGKHHEVPVTPILTDAEKKFLAPFIQQLKKLEVYEIGDLRKLLRQIETNSNSIKQWKKQVQNALETGNEQRYKELVRE
jgi:hypothetical protein